MDEFYKQIDAVYIASPHLTHYEYIAQSLDNVPALVVADASIVNRVADITLYVICEGALDRRFLPELERLHQENKFNNMCVVLNDVEDKKQCYGCYSEDGKRKYVSSRKSLINKIFQKK